MKYYRILLILAAITSPYWVGMIAATNAGPESLDGLVAALYSIFGIPTIAVIGLVISFLTRKTKRATIFSVIGYALPAAVICSWEVFSTLS